MTVLANRIFGRAESIQLSQGPGMIKPVFMLHKLDLSAAPNFAPAFAGEFVEWQTSAPKVSPGDFVHV
jgi:hypothetical protein